MLLLRHLHGFSKTLLRRRDGWLGLFQQQFPFQSKQFCLPKPFPRVRATFCASDIAPNPSSMRFLRK
jgi:hypothetical protein